MHRGQRAAAAACDGGCQAKGPGVERRLPREDAVIEVQDAEAAENAQAAAANTQADVR